MGSHARPSEGALVSHFQGKRFFTAIKGRSEEQVYRVIWKTYLNRDATFPSIFYCYQLSAINYQRSISF